MEGKKKDEKKDDKKDAKTRQSEAITRYSIISNDKSINKDEEKYKKKSREKSKDKKRDKSKDTKRHKSKSKLIEKQKEKKEIYKEKEKEVIKIFDDDEEEDGINFKRSKLKPLGDDISMISSSRRNLNSDTIKFGKKEIGDSLNTKLNTKVLQISNLKEKKEKLIDIISKDNKNEEIRKKGNESKKIVDVSKKKSEIVEKSTSKRLVEDEKVKELRTKNEQILNSIQDSFYFDIDKKRNIIKYITESGNFDTRNRNIPFYIILPNSRLRRSWDFLLTFFLLYCLLLIPIDVGWSVECFTSDTGAFIKSTYTLCSILFFFDIFLNFISAYLNEKNQYVYDIKLIAINYLKTNLIFDVLSAFPFDKIKEFDMNDCYKGYISSSKVFLLFNLLRFFKLGKYIGIVEEVFSKYINIVRIVKIFFTLIYLAHFIGNFFSGISSHAQEVIFSDCVIQEITSVSEFNICLKNSIQYNITRIYFYNVFLGIYFLTGNEFKCEKIQERIMAMVVLMISMALNASIFGNVSVLLSKISVGLDPFIQEKVDIMKEYMAFMQFDKKFISTIEEYHVNIWMKQRNMMYPANFFSNLSIALQKLIFLYQWRLNFFEISLLLPIISKEFFSDILPILKPKIFMNNDVIITEGESNCTVFLISKTGLCSVKIGGEAITVMKMGEFFGEIAIFLRSKRRTATVISEKDSDYLSIEGEDFERLLRDYPEDYEKIKKLAKDRLLRFIKLYPSKLFAKLVPKNELKDYLIRKYIYLDGEEEDKLLYGEKEENKYDENGVMHKLEDCHKILMAAKQNITYLGKIKEEVE